MGTYTPDQYQKLWKARAKAIVKAGNKASASAAHYMEASARAHAPQKTGALRAGIHARKDGKSWRVTSTVPGGFKYNFWIDQRAPYRTLHMWWNHGTGVRFAGRKGLVTSVRGAPTVYGDGSHRTTGTPGFFRYAARRTSERFKKVAVQEVRKALRVTI